MKKIYYISESQYVNLVESKKEEIRLYKEICEEINKKTIQLSESTIQLNEGIIDTIKQYVSKGLMTATLVASLLSANKVNAQQLAQAGVPKATIEQGIQKVKYDPSKMSNKQIEDRLFSIMHKNKLTAALNDYNNLNPQQKENVLNGIKSQIKSLDDINTINIGGWEKYDRTNAIKFDQTSQEKIKVVTVDTVSTIPVIKNFELNSSILSNKDALKSELEELIKGYSSIDSIVIESSSSTLRNRDQAEGLTWKELSQKRAEEISSVLIGQNIDLGGEGKNVVGKITPEMVKINSNGTNGDGTSGPKSPYETNPEYLKSYQERNIDPKFWQSASKEDALPETSLSEYQKYQYVNIKIYGRVVETETEDVPSYRYVSLGVKEFGGKIDKGNKKREEDVSKCQIKQKVPKKVKVPQFGMK